MRNHHQGNELIPTGQQANPKAEGETGHEYHHDTRSSTNTIGV